MLLDVPHAVVGQVTHQNLPPQVQDLVHHVPQPVEQIPLVLLPTGEGGEKSHPGGGCGETGDDGKERQNEDKRGEAGRLNQAGGGETSLKPQIDIKSKTG